MFLHLSVSHSAQRGISAWADTPLGRTPPPLGRYPTRQTSPQADTPLGRHPLGRHSPDGNWSGRYASYWNAFLFEKVVFLSLDSNISFYKNYTQVTLTCCSAMGLIWYGWQHYDVWGIMMYGVIWCVVTFLYLLGSPPPHFITGYLA